MLFCNDTVLRLYGGMGGKEKIFMYEYVKKSEYEPVRKELEKIIKKVQIEMWKKYNLSFQFQLIGSGKRHLITRLCGGNRGYDFDYNLIIPYPGDGYHYKAAIIKKQFINAFKNALRGTEYSFPKDSTSAITIKVVDVNNKRIRHSCDFAIIYYECCDENSDYFYLRNNKKQNTYQFAFRSLNYDVEEKVDDICAERNGWERIRKEYLKLKNINEGKNKHSFSLYVEAVNNVYNQMFY